MRELVLGRSSKFAWMSEIYIWIGSVCYDVRNQHLVCIGNGFFTCHTSFNVFSTLCSQKQWLYFSTAVKQAEDTSDVYGSASICIKRHVYGSTSICMSTEVHQFVCLRKYINLYKTSCLWEYINLYVYRSTPICMSTEVHQFV